LSRNVNDHTLSCLGVTAFLGADVVVIADLFNVEALSGGWAARVSCACIVVVTVDSSVRALSGLSIASVDGARIVVVTVDLLNNTLSCVLAAR
jgi:hypothetical protein